LYDPGTLRTLFFEFENDTWENEMMAFKDTDVEVPATLIVDGKTYKDVGVRFRGNSSFRMVPQGLKHSMNISMDAFVKDQTLLGFNTLNLLNSHADPSFLHAVLYLQAARELLPAPRANYVRVVINGESWGVYPSVEQVNKTFLREWFKTDSGARWKAPGSLNGGAGLEYWGEDPAPYKQTYEIKTKDDPKSWQALIRLTRTLNTTPPAKLEAALAPLLDIDGVLRFLAIDNTLVNNDGYWVRASDYFIYLDPSGKFHITPNDVNEAFGGVGGGFPMHAGPDGPDPLVGLHDTSKPLRSKLLAAPALRAKYLAYTRQVATKWLDWKQVEPIAAKYRALISAEVKADRRKIYSFDAFERGPAELRDLITRRREYILNYPQRLDR
jgi:spore coat protein CotH